MNRKYVPRTEFPMRANAALREPQFAEWADRRNETPPECADFVLHSGPPFANGDAHVGHALNFVLKDVAVRRLRGRGYEVSFRPGFDCHGLPVELKVLRSCSPSERASLHPLELRRRCRAEALRAVEAQTETMRRLGVDADWDDPYLTMNPDYEASELEAVARLLEKGLLERRTGEVWYSPSSRSVLAESELEYGDDGEPLDWRTGEPVERQSREQWFFNLDFPGKEEALEEVSWHGQKKRFASTVGDRAEWCLSRQRTWGLPVPAFRHGETGDLLMTPETVRHFARVVANHPTGSDAWWELPVADLLPPPYEPSAWEKTWETFDVWLDSGLSWFYLSGDDSREYPLDLYWEGSDQHRGWFQSSFLTGVALAGRSPYLECRTHGFVLDSGGRKMSKSLGNVLNPGEFMDEFGADVLRLWCVSGDSRGDLRATPESLDAAKDCYRKLRNTFRFCLANLSDHEDRSPDVHTKAVLDFYEGVEASYARHDFAGVKRRLDEFLGDFLPGYLGTETTGLKKDLYLCYEGEADDPRRRRAQNDLCNLFWTLVVAVEPLTPHLVAEAMHFYRLPRQASA